MNARALFVAALAGCAAVVGFFASLIAVYQFAFPATPVCPSFPEAGRWRLITTPRAANQATASEVGKQNIFYIRFSKECDRLSGKGIKIAYGGSEVKASSRSSISLNGTLPKHFGDQFEITFDETWPSGASSQGYFNVALDSDGAKMDGKFYSAVGDISGNAVFNRD